MKSTIVFSVILAVFVTLQLSGNQNTEGAIIGSMFNQMSRPVEKLGAACGGSCLTSLQCMLYSWDQDCRCGVFACTKYKPEVDIRQSLANYFETADTSSQE